MISWEMNVNFVFYFKLESMGINNLVIWLDVDFCLLIL